MSPGLDDAALDTLNREVVIRLQLEGIAVPSTTTVNGHAVIRINITNHRTTRADLELLVLEVRRTAREFLGE